ncbi:LytTR family DNA-binding domain-containing protein [Bacteroides sp. 224]|uniref:LytR/AlgR family response regulator transcription factor n=1 Tax=Bacteroides sp. 224 TaxID=2302936 RepID=UPI0013D65170|nr:LytTR family DNA-binding domain-containing protein [Bacteroides sp. 224]NDV64163.1 DNA-binding response regulator [Bacteroides sp. 224]
MIKKIRTIIVDDLPAAATKLREDLQLHPEIEVIECVSSAKEAIVSIIKHQPDLLFLDIEMPEMSGLELLSLIQDKVHSMRVVFYTAYNQYLIDAVRTSAFDYLQKPYLTTELSFIINRLLTISPEQMVDFRDSFRRLIHQEDRFAIQTVMGLMLVKCREVGVFQYMDRHWVMKLANEKQYKLRTNVGAKELLALSSSFMQINQQCIVNLDYLISIENKTLKCILCPPFSDLSEIASTRYYKKIKESLDII